jgi:hypothetical protein
MRPKPIVLLLLLGISLCLAGYLFIRPIETPVESSLMAARCTAGPAAVLLGERYTHDGAEHLVAKARQLSGATTVQFLKPGDYNTGDYRPGRLTVFVDATGLIREVLCG